MECLSESTILCCSPPTYLCHHCCLVPIHGPLCCRCPGSHQQPGRGPGPTRASPTPFQQPCGTEGTVASGTDTPALPSSQILTDINLPTTPTVKILKRIPRASWELAVRKLVLMIEAVVEANDPSAWNHLICFGTRSLHPPRRGGCHWNLASEVNKLIREEDPDSTPTQPCLSQGLYTR